MIQQTCKHHKRYFASLEEEESLLIHGYDSGQIDLEERGLGEVWRDERGGKVWSTFAYQAARRSDCCRYGRGHRSAYYDSGVDWYN